MATALLTDTFLTGGRGSPNTWSPGSDGNNWTQSRGTQTMSYDSVNHQGVLTYNGSTTTGVMTYSSQNLLNVEIMVNVVASTGTTIAGSVARFTSSSNFYACIIGNAANDLEIRKDVAGTFSTVASAPFTWTVGTKYTIRFSVQGNLLKGKIWQQGSSEPVAWTCTGTDSSLTAAGLVGVSGTPSASTQTAKFDSFAVTSAHLLISDGLGGVFS